VVNIKVRAPLKLHNGLTGKYHAIWGHVKNYGENIILAFKKDFGDIIITGVFAISFIRAFHSC
jgi:hypothetical protein